MPLAPISAAVHNDCAFQASSPKLSGSASVGPYFFTRPSGTHSGGESDKHLERMPAGSTGNPITPWSKGRGVLLSGRNRQKQIHYKSRDILNPGLKEQGINILCSVDAPLFPSPVRQIRSP
jgi:hypothetical protein